MLEHYQTWSLCNQSILQACKVDLSDADASSGEYQVTELGLFPILIPI